MIKKLAKEAVKTYNISDEASLNALVEIFSMAKI
jgi:hypothetical protein